MFCKECGAAVADGVKFCGSCGIKVEDVPMEAPASASDQTAQAIPPEKKTTEQNYWDKLNPTQRKGHIYGIPFFILMAIAGVTLKNTAKDSPQNSPAIDDAISRSWVSFKSVDNNFALILDASPELRKNVKEYIERAVHGGLAKDSIKKIGNHEIIDRIKYAKLDNIVTGSLALIVLMPVLGPGFDNLVTWYKLDGMKATDGERKTVNGKDIKVRWGGPVEVTVVPDGNNDKAVTLGGEADTTTLGGQATPAPAVAPIPTVAQPRSPAGAVDFELGYVPANFGDDDRKLLRGACINIVGNLLPRLGYSGGVANIAKCHVFPYGNGQQTASVELKVGGVAIFFANPTRVWIGKGGSGQCFLSGDITKSFAAGAYDECK